MTLIHLNAAFFFALAAILLGLLWFLREAGSANRDKTELTKLSLVANTENAVLITNQEGNIEWVNDGFNRISGHALSHVVSKPPGTVVLGGTPNPKTLQQIRSGLSTRKAFTVEMLCSHKNGHRFWLSVNFTPVFDGRDRITNFIGVGADVTARKRAQ